VFRRCNRQDKEADFTANHVRRASGVLLTMPSSLHVLPGNWVVKVRRKLSSDSALDTIATYLGVTLDRTLSFREHLTKTARQLKNRNNLLMKLAGSSWGANTETLRTSIMALCYSVAEYCAPVWSRFLHIESGLHRVTVVPVRRNGTGQPLICVLVVKSKRCPTLSTLVLWRS